MPAIPETAFIAFGLGSQAVLAAFFAARRWLPRLAERYGWLAYAVRAKTPARHLVPRRRAVLAAVYGPAPARQLGYLWQLSRSVAPVEWRSPPRLGLLVPYAALYFWAQMFLGGRSGTLQRGAWSAFLVLLAVNTVLNLSGHFRRPESRRVSRRG